MAQPRNIPQSKEVLLKSYNIRLKEDCKIMLENYFGNHLILGAFRFLMCQDMDCIHCGRRVSNFDHSFLFSI